MKSEKNLTLRQWEVLKCLNPFEGRPLTQKETAMFLGITERHVRRIFRQFKVGFPEAYERFIKLKKGINKTTRCHKNKTPFLCGDCNNWCIGGILEIGNRTFKILEKF